MNGASVGSSSYHDTNARVRVSAASNKIAVEDGRGAGGPLVRHGSASGPRTNGSLVASSKYAKRRRRKTSGPIRVLAVIMTIILTLIFVFVRRSWNTTTSNSLPKKPLTRAIRDKLLAQLPQHHSSRTHQDRLAQLPHESTHDLEHAFWNARQQVDITSASMSNLEAILKTWLRAHDQEILDNYHGGTRWIRPYLLPPLVKKPDQDDMTQALGYDFKFTARNALRKDQAEFFKASHRMQAEFQWEREWDELYQQQAGKTLGPRVDYTDAAHYQYHTLPKSTSQLPPDPAVYPPLQPLSQLIETWPQDEDFDFGKHGGYIQEQLWHFNFSNPEELAMAQVLRDNELPFKLYDVPELTAASLKWTDDYVSAGFTGGKGLFGASTAASGVAQESPNNYFAFFTPKNWNIHQMGLPPTRNNDWTFSKWAKHARYADAMHLSHNQPHVYWQAGVDRMERYGDKSQWTFISRDLPSFSSTEENFFVFHPQEQKGIQCRFGERGVVAATHYDGGRNFVGMITGAKRYILSPPNQCPKLGVFTSKKSPIYRHSLLNFAHIQYLFDKTKQTEAKGMSEEERAWLERAGQALSVETVLKAGEALYIPSHWFHYIISVQKSAQCNVRSGIDQKGHPVFGNRETVEQCRGP